MASTYEGKTSIRFCFGSRQKGEISLAFVLRGSRWIRRYIYLNQSRIRAFAIRQIKAVVQASLILLAVGWIFYVVSLLVETRQVFQATMEREVGLEILRALIEVDGVLLGFAGLIAVYSLSEMHSRIRDFSWPQYLSARDKFVGRKSSIAWLTALTVLAFALSILSALGAMSRLQNSAQSGEFYWTLSFMFQGMAAILAIVYVTNLS